MGRNGVKRKKPLPLDVEGARDLKSVLEESKREAEQKRIAWERIAKAPTPAATLQLPLLEQPASTPMHPQYPPAEYLSALAAAGVAHFENGALKITFETQAAAHKLMSERVEALQLQMLSLLETMNGQVKVPVSHAGPIVVDDEEIDDELSNEERAREVTEAQKEHDKILFHSAD